MDTLVLPPCVSSFDVNSSGSGVCVLPKHRLVVCADNRTHQLHVRSLDDGSLVRIIGGEGRGKGQFRFEYTELCASPDGSGVLVGDTANGRVQEISVMPPAECSWVRFIGADGVLRSPVHVDCNTNIIAVSDDCCRISVFSYCTGDVLVHIGRQGYGLGQLFHPRGVRLLRDGSGLAVADWANHRLCVFKLNGEFVHKLDGFTYPRDLLECNDGGFLVSENSTSCFTSSTLVKVSLSGKYARSGAHYVSDDTNFCLPCALAALPDGGLVVRYNGLDRERGSRCEVYYGLELRERWMRLVCVFVVLKYSCVHMTLRPQNSMCVGVGMGNVCARTI